MATWIESLQQLLQKKHGAKNGKSLFEKYNSAFPPSYIDEYDISLVVSDIDFIEQLSEQNPLAVNFYISTEPVDHPLHLRLFQWQKPVALSDILPMLENMGLKTYNEHPYKIKLQNNQYIWISDFAVEYLPHELDMKKIKSIFEEAFIQIYNGIVENDGFNKLVLAASLSSREISIIRGYAKYLRQIHFRFSQTYIEKALINNPDITKDLIELFLAMHDFSKQHQTKSKVTTIEKRIITALDAVSSLDEDRIIRRLLDVIKATLRTNYFLQNNDGTIKPYISYKLNSSVIPDMPLPVPMYEIFVYSPRFEAIHLRNAKVARGGLRWSDRAEDFRTEVLGLMKAQVVKNSVIIPSGAKGGFVLKTAPFPATREQIQEEVIHCYKSFIRGMLDITDNIIDKKTVHPKNLVCLDDDDPYLVVAADKGTATFSDIANSISNEYQFWLGDAFASGGSMGYDHKKMGITARGAWESIKRHFRELNVDIHKTDITVVGIGDMSGDVFGNGLIYSNHLKLIAAFDHRHIFLDPDPDPKLSYQERKRLFALPASSWEDYNPKLISKGGGVYKRSLKSIQLSPQIRSALAINEESLTPNELIRAILMAPVDLLFNGGIGTYVKSITQTNTDVGDRTNDYCRVDGFELRCKVVGEGGNLGFTQLGRIEFALKGGLINTDFIDNSAGVDCSDHEVNLKILLDREVHNKKLTFDNRNKLLASLTDKVAQLVLKDNYNQALVMSFSAYHANLNISLHHNYLKELEKLNIVNRKVEYLPDDKTLLERKAAGLGFTRPELAVLLAYTKIYIKQELLKSTILDDAYLSNDVTTAFPDSMRKKYHQQMHEHPLNKDIVATQLSNQIVNEMGITFAYRVQMETGALIPEIVRAYVVASSVFATPELQALVQLLDFQIDVSAQYEMLYHLRRLVNLATRWFLNSKHLDDNLESLIDHFAKRVKQLEGHVPVLMSGKTKEYLDKLTMEFESVGLPTEVAHRIASYRAIYTTLNIIEVATQNNFDLEKTAKVYFTAGERVSLLWFRDQIGHDNREGHWNVLARLTLRDELDMAQCALTVAILKQDKKENDVIKLIDHWLKKNEPALTRWNRLLSMVYESSSIDYTMFFIAIRELIGLIQARM